MQILPEIPSLGARLGQGLSAGLNAGLGSAINLHGEMAKKLSGQKADKQQEKLQAVENGLGTIEQMRGLISSAGPSNWFSGLFGGETTKKRAELAALGRSLIPLVAAGVPIRNQKEFEAYTKTITNPNSRQAELEGALDGIEKVLTRSADQSDEPRRKTKKKSSGFDVTNPEHKARRDLVLKKTGGDRKKAQMILEEEFGSGE